MVLLYLIIESVRKDVLFITHTGSSYITSFYYLNYHRYWEIYIEAKTNNTLRAQKYVRTHTTSLNFTTTRYRSPMKTINLPKRLQYKITHKNAFNA